MSYLIKKTFWNGYRCGCCHQKFEPEETWTESLEAAMAVIPEEQPEQGDFGGLFEVQVFDGSNNGTEIGSGKLSWPQGCGKRASYARTNWYGFRTLPDGTVESFDKIYGNKETEDETWNQIIERLREKHNQRQVAQAQAALEAAQQKLDSLETKTDGGT